jgi:hypothetical protein
MANSSLAAEVATLSPTRLSKKESDMSNFFPRQTVEFRFEEPKAFRRISYSLVEMALVTGVLMRLYRVIVLTHGSNNWLYIGGSIAIGLLFLLGMLTAHLANYPLHQYVWRAAAFVGLEVVGEMAVSALLIAVGLEANGTVRAHWDDWVGLSLNALVYRGLAILLWTLILAGVVQIVRRTIVHDDEGPEPKPNELPAA